MLAPHRIEMLGLCKSFGSTVALDGVDLTVNPGAVHALIGENGAGKSTLMKVLSGACPPDAGRMLLDGEPYSPRGPLEARRRGVVMIYQELSLAPHLSVAANIMLGMEPSQLGWIQRRRLEQQAAQALQSLGHGEIALGAPVSDLSIGKRQVVELARALAVDARVVVLDEPTSSLAGADVERLFQIIGRLRKSGITVIYISHFLEEIERVADQFTVLRDGRSVGTGRIGEVDKSQMIEMMVGRRVSEMFPRLPHTIGEPVLQLTELSTAGVQRANLVLRRGEILGVAGLIGAGRTELLRAIFGLQSVRRGEVSVLHLSGPSTPYDRLAQGVGMLSEDRKGEGLAHNLSLTDNLTLSKLKPYSRRGLLDRDALTRSTKHWMAKLGIKSRGASDSASSLSGGNQQKLALARLLHHDCDVLLLDEPTRGIDVTTKTEIYRLIGELAQAGKAILFVSSYVPELLGVCDTVAVMCRGSLGEKTAASEATEHNILAAATGTGAALR